MAAAPSAPADQATARTTRRRRRRRRPVVLATQIGLAVAVVADWELGVRAEILDGFFFSTPSDIATRMIDWFATGSIWEHLRITLMEAVLALLIGGVLGLAIGFLLARVEFLAAVVDPYIKILNSLPRVVLAPISCSGSGSASGPRWPSASRWCSSSSSSTPTRACARSTGY